MKLFSMLGAIFDEISTGANTYVYDEDYDCLYLPVSSDFVTHVLEKKCNDCGVLIFTMDNNFNYSVDSVIIDADEQPTDLREDINEYLETFELDQIYHELSCAISNIFCKQ